MTNDQLDKLERLAKAATPGPWTHTTFMSGTQNVGYPGERAVSFVDQVLSADAAAICYETDAQPSPWLNVSHRPEDRGVEADPQRSANGAFIAAANPAAVLELIAAARGRRNRDRVCSFCDLPATAGGCAVGLTPDDCELPAAPDASGAAEQVGMSDSECAKTPPPNAGEGLSQLIADLRRAYSDMTPSQIERAGCDLDGHAFAIQKAIKVLRALRSNSPEAG